MTTTSASIDHLGLCSIAVDARGVAAMLGISRSQWLKLSSAGKTPLPVRLGTRGVRWRVEELRAWLTAGAPDRQTWERLLIQEGGRR